jgi:hypothetical protein
MRIHTTAVAVKRAIPRPLRRALRRFWPTTARPFWDHVRMRGLPSPVPPTPAFKHREIARYAPGINAFVETGTYRGDTVEAMRSRFRDVWSIELSHDLATAAARRFAGAPNVRILEGDSATILPTILPELLEPSLFWLDGHWCGGETAHGETETPLLAELIAVLARPQPDVILVDDARLLGTRGYPSVEAIVSMVEGALPPRALSIVHDIARIVPVTGPGMPSERSR